MTTTLMTTTLMTTTLTTALTLTTTLTTATLTTALPPLGPELSPRRALFSPELSLVRGTGPAAVLAAAAAAEDPLPGARVLSLPLLHGHGTRLFGPARLSVSSPGPSIIAASPPASSAFHDRHLFLLLVPFDRFVGIAPDVREVHDGRVHR